jgi:tetratricopeptide (TPR) repeat protein
MVSGAIGRSRSTASAQDVQWAVRRLLESLARARPLVVAFDDIQWAEPPLLDLIQYLAAYVTSAPVGVVCLARDDLLERRPSWEAAFGRGATLRLRPLSDTDSARLLRGLAGRRGARLRRYEVLAAAEGNPLFLEHLVAMRADDPAGATPPSIQALLAARIDDLPRGPRRVIEAAAIEGRGFHRGVVSALLADQRRVDVDAALAELERRELVRPSERLFPGEQGYRFTHLLVRDAAYELIPKGRRAELHVGFAEWLRAASEDRRELDEIIGYHLEQAHGYRRQLGRVDDVSHRALAADASGYLSAAGLRVLGAGDHAAAANLLRRAAALRAADDPERAAILIDLGAVFREEGRFDESQDALGQALRHADAGAAALHARAQVERLLGQLLVDPDGAARQAARQSAEIGSALDSAGDHAGLARLWHLRALRAWIRAQAGEAAEAWRHAASEAGIAGDERMLSDALGWEASALTHGPTPVDEALVRCDVILDRLGGNHPWAEAQVQHQVAGLRAMRGEFDAAFALLDAANAVLAGYSPTVDAAVSAPEVLVSMLASAPARAERHLRAGRRQLRAMGERAVLAWTEANLAMAVLAQGRGPEADRLARRVEGLASDDDIGAQTLWRQVRAVVLAERGRVREAARLATEAVTLSEDSDWLYLRAGALEDLGRVNDLAGRPQEARQARDAALDVYRRKGATACTVRLERMLERHASA